jgi:hypothetical protein
LPIQIFELLGVLAAKFAERRVIDRSSRG